MATSDTESFPDTWIGPSVEWYFFKSISDKGEYELLPNQYYPVESGDGYLLHKRIDLLGSLRVASQALRLPSTAIKGSSHPIGTVYAKKGISLFPSGFFLNSAGTTCYVVETQHASMAPPGDANHHASSAYAAYKYQAASGTAFPPIVPKSSSLPKSGFIHRIRRKYTPPSLDADSGTPFHVNEKTWTFLVRNYKRRVPTLLVGPKGSGKTDLCRILFENVANSGERFSEVNMGAISDASSSLQGTMSLEERNGASVTQFKPAELLYHISVPGMVVLEEVNRSEAAEASQNLLFSLLDQRKYLPLPFSSGVEFDQSGLNYDREINAVRQHPKSVLFATANEGFEYTGTSRLDAAFRSRWSIVRIGYPSPAELTDILVAVTKINRSEAYSIAACVSATQASFREGNLSESLSTREALRMAEYISDGYTVGEAVDIIVSGIYADSADGMSEADLVRSFVPNLPKATA